MTKQHKVYFDNEEIRKEIEDWTNLTEEELFELKENLLSTKYGRGGENINFFPNLIDPGRLNTQFNGEYIEKLPKRIIEQNLKEYKGNGKVDIIRIDTLNKSHYIIILIPEKTLEVDLWQLEMNNQPPYTQYKSGKKIKTIKVSRSKYHITNIFTNMNKAINQAKRISLLFKLGDTSFKSLERIKEGRNNYTLDLIEDGKFIIRNGYNGPSYNSLDELLGRTHTIELNIMEFLG